MDAFDHIERTAQKKSGSVTERPLTTGLFLLRCLQIGLSIEDLEHLTVGMVYDIMIERVNDEAKDEYDTVRMATQADFDNF